MKVHIVFEQRGPKREIVEIAFGQYATTTDQNLKSKVSTGPYGPGAHFCRVRRAVSAL